MDMEYLHKTAEDTIKLEIIANAKKEALVDFLIDCIHSDFELSNEVEKMLNSKIEEYREESVKLFCTCCHYLELLTNNKGKEGENNANVATN